MSAATCFCCGADHASGVVCDGCQMATYCSAACQAKARTLFDHDTHCATFKLHAPALGVRIYNMATTQRPGAPSPNEVFAWFERELVLKWPAVANVPVVNQRPDDTVDDPARKFIDTEYVAMMSQFFLSHGISNADVNVFLGEMNEIASRVPNDREYKLEIDILVNHAVIDGDAQDPVFIQISALLANKKAPFPEAQITALLTTRFDKFDLDATEIPAVVDELRLFHEYGPSFTDSLINDLGYKVYLDAHPIETALGVNGNTQLRQRHKFTSFIELVYYWNWERIHEAYTISIAALRASKRVRDADYVPFPDTLRKAKRQRVTEEVARARQAHLDDPTTIPLEMRLQVAMWLPARDIIRYLLRVAPSDQSNITKAVVGMIIERDFLEPQRRHIASLDATARDAVDHFRRYVAAELARTHMVLKVLQGDEHIVSWFQDAYRACALYSIMNRWLWRQNYNRPSKIAQLTPDGAYAGKQVNKFGVRIERYYRSYVRTQTGFLMVYYAALADKLANVALLLQRGSPRDIVYTGDGLYFRALFNMVAKITGVATLQTEPSDARDAFVVQADYVNTILASRAIPAHADRQRVFVVPLERNKRQKPRVFHMFIAHLLVTVDPTLTAFIRTPDMTFSVQDFAVSQPANSRARRIRGAGTTGALVHRVNVATFAPVTDSPFVLRAVYDPAEPEFATPVTPTTLVVADDMLHEFDILLPAL